MELIRPSLHFGLHILVPGIIAYLFFKKHWKKVWLLFIATMFIDLDHLMADPIYDINRCSINYHPLHSYIALSIYVILLIPKTTRVIAIGLLMHLLTDYTDCLWLS